jgi:hypothetical protein
VEQRQDTVVLVNPVIPFSVAGSGNLSAEIVGRRDLKILSAAIVRASLIWQRHRKRVRVL